jgi:hypothetical protein
LRRVENSRTYVGRFHFDNPLTPYGAVAVTLKSDGNTGLYDPHPAHLSLPDQSNLAR